MSDLTPEQKNKRQQELEDVRAVLSSPAGERLFWRYFELTGIFKNSFDGSFGTYFNEGKRIIGTTMLNDMNEADPAAFSRIQMGRIKPKEGKKTK